MKIWLSAAHAPQSQGATYGGWSEYLLSRLISGVVVEYLLEYGVSAAFADVGAEMSGESYGEVKAAKARRIPADGIGVELHFQKPGGVAILHHSENETATQFAISLLPSLLSRFGKRHWEGLIPVPNAAYYSESPQYVPFFLATEKAAVIVEMGAIGMAEWWHDNYDTIGGMIAEAIAEALEAMA